jgi:hypothetical protein
MLGQNVVTRQLHMEALVPGRAACRNLTQVKFDSFQPLVDRRRPHALLGSRLVARLSPAEGKAALLPSSAVSMTQPIL